MALNGIDGGGLQLPAHLRTPGATNGASGERRVREQAVAPATAPLHAPGGEATLPVEPPPGTDPALWSVLTSEERVFFARVRSLGPLTYGPGTRPEAQPQAMPRGARLDVRV